MSVAIPKTHIFFINEIGIILAPLRGAKEKKGRFPGTKGISLHGVSVPFINKISYHLLVRCGDFLPFPQLLPLLAPAMLPVTASRTFGKTADLASLFFPFFSSR
jgi:hypothetical protein